MARTGLRMIPTFPSSPLRFRTAGFPSVRLQSWPIRQRLPMIMRWLSLLAACPSSDQVCLRPSCSPRQHESPVLGRRRAARSSAAMRATDVALLEGPSLRSGLCCPGPLTLNRPHPPHSQAHHDAFAARERLGNPRVVPSFRPLRPRGAARCIHPDPSRDALAFTGELSGRHSRCYAIWGLIGSPLLRAAELLASLAGDFYSRAFNGLVTLAVAGYDYGGNWTISTGGTLTAGTPASFAARPSDWVSRYADTVLDSISRGE